MQRVLRRVGKGGMELGGGGGPMERKKLSARVLEM